MEVVTGQDFAGFQIDPSQNVGLAVDYALYPTVADMIAYSPDLKAYTPMGKVIADRARQAASPRGQGATGLALSAGLDKPSLLRAPSMSEMQVKQVLQVTGFDVEIPNPSAKTITQMWDEDKLRSALKFEPYHYQYFIYRSDHFVFVGTINKRGSKDEYDPIVIILCPFQSFEGDESLRIVIDTRLGDVQHIFTPPLGFQDKIIKKGYWDKQKTLPREVADEVVRTIQEKFGRLSETISINVTQAHTDQNLRDDLLKFELKDPLRKKVFSIGLLHSLRGQTDEGDMFSNNDQTPLLQEFMAFLGDKITLPGWTGYRGDLDVDSDSTGKYGLFRRWKGFEIMFHGSTLLPYQEGTTEQLHRKRRIGNDIGVVIFQEGGTYTPPIRSQFLHAYYIVSPVVKDGLTYYRLAITTQEGVPHIEPDLPDPPLFPKTPAFRAFLLSKIINGILASMNHPNLREKIWCHPKEVFLTDVVATYGKHQHHKQLGVKEKKRRSFKK